MAKSYDNYEVYEVVEAAREIFGGVNLEERLENFQLSLDGICELLEGLLESQAKEAKEEEEKKEAKAKEAKAKKEYMPAFKIGADIGEEKKQLDVIAKIFGNA